MYSRIGVIMIYEFVECESDYSKLLFPYEIWGRLEPGESTEIALSKGFLAPSTNVSIDRFYLSRSGRVDLDYFQSDQRTRYIRRNASQFLPKLVEFDELDRIEQISALAERYFRSVSDPGNVRKDNFSRMIKSRFCSILFEVWDSRGQLVGLAPILVSGRSCQYGIPIYAPELRTMQIGHYILISLLHILQERDYKYLYVGTCYTEKSLYKTRFKGFEFFDGLGWTGDRDRLKNLVSLVDK